MDTVIALGLGILIGLAISMVICAFCMLDLGGDDYDS